MTLNKPLVINNWEEGIAASPHLGFGLLKNVEIWSYPGAVRAGKKPVTMFHPAYASTFTADDSTDICTATAHVPNLSTCVQLTTTGTLPAGLSLSTNYFVIRLSSTTFKLASTIALAEAGTGIDITDTGTGTHTITTVNPGTVTHIVKDPRTSTTFLIDSNGVVWFNDGSMYYVLSTNTATTNASGNGLAVFRGSDNWATYLFAFRNKAIDVINVYGTSNRWTPVWIYGWNPATGGSGAMWMNTYAGIPGSHHAIVGQDNIIYYTDGRYIGSIAENAGHVFNPADTSTFTALQQALDLPLDSWAYWLEQLGVNLLISVSNDKYIYPWDRSSDSYGLPIPIGECGGKMKNIGNVVYILAGTRGNIYYTQGTYSRLFATLPVYLTNNDPTSYGYSENGVYWGGIEAVLGRLIVGVGAVSGQSGVYMIDPNGVMTLDNYPSTGQAPVTALLADADGLYYMGYAGGADMFRGISLRYTSRECVIQSQLFRIGNKTEKTKFSSVEVQIANGIEGNITLGYRTDLTSAFTTFATFTTDTENTSYETDIGLIDLENVQIQVLYGHGIDIMEVRLIP